jgi:hypothetical protein
MDGWMDGCVFNVTLYCAGGALGRVYFWKGFYWMPKRFSLPVFSEYEQMKDGEKREIQADHSGRAI